MLNEKWALISVSDKTGIIDLAKSLIDFGFKILASDGTHAHLLANGIESLRVAEFTGAEEIFDGRVKTLHPLIHGAILFDRNNPEHLKEVKRLAIKPIEVVVVNLYDEASFDIGGPALIRAAAKNHKYVAVLTSPSQYSTFTDAQANGNIESIRKEFAKAAIELTARYDLAILRDISAPLRYGENPHQTGALAGSSGIAAATLIQGVEPSYNNYLDMDCATLIASDHPLNTSVIVKHGMPCGVGRDEDQMKSFLKALESDETSAFGGVIATNFEIDTELAAKIASNFFEVLIAPSFTHPALLELSKRRKMRVLILKSRERKNQSVREINGGFLFQSLDEIESSQDWKLVSGEHVESSMKADLEFAWRCVARTRSNSVVIAKDLATIGIGMGEVSRLDASRNAVTRAGSRAKDSVAASDGFFPFADGLEILAHAGVRAIIAPEGSIRDEEVIKAAMTHGITLYFAPRRHFSHN